MNHLLNRVLALGIAAVVTTAATAGDIVDTAVEAGKFNTLAAALDAAGLVDTLKGKGPFTVFAPTDDAFAKLPAGTVETLLKPENKDKLTAILTYHVVPGKVMAKQVVGLSGATTVNGQRVDISVNGSTVKVDGATVTATDIGCDNGVIHIIDSVILPADKTIPETAAAAGSFGTLLAAAKAAGLAETLGSDGPFTVLAPTDDAFAALPEGTVANLLKPENKQQLVDILTYHVLSGRVYSDAVVKADSAKTLQGSPVKIDVESGNVMINNAKVLKTDIDASNGVIHVIDSVLLPPAKNANARQMLENAVAQGAPLYNAGHHAACAQVYEQTLQRIMTSQIAPEYRHHMETVLTTARHQTCQTTRAWTLRRGIDNMYVQLAGSN